MCVCVCLRVRLNLKASFLPVHMNRKMAISVESSINAACEGVTVLLVDGDLNCLTIISEMLRRFGYKGI